MAVSREEMRRNEAYFLDPHMRSTALRLYSEMAAKSTSVELV